ncbi:SsrA-binding protein SmpB [Candidatus Saccharibacteria bacterium]|nr:SsrA-binding protein SmpB [Candidatus Saccharibacteria bacterium]
MAQQKPIRKPSAIVNRRARFDYALGDEITAGISLSGPEVRAARDGHIQLKGAYVQIRGNELWLQGASFSIKLNERGKPGARAIDDSPRKLLAHRKQIEALIASKAQGNTIVPLRLITSGRFIKVVIAVGKGKKHYDKRETLKRRDQEREANRAIKHS